MAGGLDPAAGRKKGIANANLRAQSALVDPLLTHSMPPSMTANTGHRRAGPGHRRPRRQGAHPDRRRHRARGHPHDDAGARGRLPRRHRRRCPPAMSCGSMMAGLTMNISDCTAEHSLGQAIGGISHVPHGLTIGLVLAETLERERAHVPGVLDRVADAMGEPDDGSADGSRAVRAVRRILADSTSRCSPASASPRATSTTSPTWRWRTTSSPCRPSRGRRPRWSRLRPALRLEDRAA